MNNENKVKKIVANCAKKFDIAPNSIGAMWIEEAIQEGIKLGRGRMAHLRRGRKA